MTLSPIGRRAGMLSLTAAVLIVLSQVMRLVGGRLLGPDWATTPAYTVTYTIALLGMAALLLALTSRRASLGSPRITCQSRALTDTALIRTSTSLSPGTGVGTSSNRRNIRRAVAILNKRSHIPSGCRKLSLHQWQR